MGFDTCMCVLVGGVGHRGRVCFSGRGLAQLVFSGRDLTGYVCFSGRGLA